MKYIDCAIQGPPDSQFLVFQEFQERKNESVSSADAEMKTTLTF